MGGGKRTLLQPCGAVAPTVVLASFAQHLIPMYAGKSRYLGVMAAITAGSSVASFSLLKTQ
jgi:hypothetical protein